MQHARPDGMLDTDVELRGIFEGVLPRTEKKNGLSLLLHPHFGDFHRKDYLRTPVGIRYGLTDRWDIATEIEGYFSHGLGEVAAFEQLGISEIQLTTKYRARWSPLLDWQMASQLRYTHPLDHPPIKLIDGLEHIMPTVTFARTLARWPGSEVFFGTGMDLVSRTDIDGTLDDNHFGDSANSFTGGMVWQRGQRAYTFETTYATTALLGPGETQHRIQLRPGVIFRIPDRFTFSSRGDWRMGIAAKITYGPDGPEWGVAVKFRGEFDLKRLLRR